MNTQIKISKINASYIKVDCSEVYIEQEISDAFKFQIANAKFDPRVKKGIWDGYKKLFNRKFKRLYYGLLPDLISFCKKNNYTYSISNDVIKFGNITKDDVNDLVTNVINPQRNKETLVPRDYQIDMVTHMLRSNRSISLSATSSGKSLSLYLAIRIYQLLEEFHNKHILVIVPYASLVEQLYNDFDEYSDDNWNIQKHVQKMSGKYDKFINKQIVITTWQTASKLNTSIFKNDGECPVAAVFIDETHSVRGEVLSKFVDSLTDTYVRHGVTGTLDGFECNEMLAKGLLGPVKKIVDAKQIIDNNQASKLFIRPIVFKYSDDIKKQFYKTVKENGKSKEYHTEIEFLNSNETRNNVIVNMIQKTKGNKLVLFDRVEGYGKELYEKCKQTHKNTFLIIGDVDVKEREEIRKCIEQFDDAIVFASYGTTSTGVNIPKLHNAFLISSTKSKVRLLQSIGRMMRLHESKDGKAVIYDIVDDLSLGSVSNYTLRHFFERMKLYKSEGHPVKFANIELKS